MARVLTPPLDQTTLYARTARRVDAAPHVPRHPHTDRPASNTLPFSDQPERLNSSDPETAGNTSMTPPTAASYSSRASSPRPRRGIPPHTQPTPSPCSTAVPASPSVYN